MCIWHAEARRAEKKKMRKEKGNERDVIFFFFLPLPSPLTVWSVRLVLGEEEEERGWEGGAEERGEENTEETIKEKCKHGGQNADKRHKTLHLHVLNSPLSFSLWTVLWNPRTAVGY